MAVTPYAERIISLTIQLQTGKVFEGTGFNTITLGPIGSKPYSNLRCVVQIQNASAPFPGFASVRIFGLTLSQINQLTIAGILFDGRRNQISIQAGDSIAGLTTIFTGEIWQAYPQANQPEMAFLMLANPANNIQLAPAQSTTFTGSIAGSTVLSQVLKSTGLTLENNGVTAVISNPHFAGSAWDQINQLVQAMGCFGFLDAAKGVYAIWPKNGSRSGQTSMISPATGMIGYPEFQQTQIRVRKLFDPTATLTVGNKIQVQSEFKAATGTWTIYQFQHDIAAQMPDGPWETAILATAGAAGS